MPHYTAELANAVSKYADVTVIGSNEIKLEYFKNNIKIIKIFDKLDVSVGDLSSILSFENLKSLISFRKIKIIKDIKPDILHFTSPLILPLPFFILFYGINKSIPTIFTMHSMHQDSGILREFIGNINCLCGRMINYKKVVCHTERDKQELLRIKRFTNEQICVIPHGSYEFFTNNKNVKKRQYNELTSNNCILFFGYIKKYKGLEYLIRAANLISNDFPDLKVIIAGEGDLAPYNDLIGENKQNVFEIHNRFVTDEEASLLFQKASLVILPYSQMTGQSGIMNIALAFGKPVIATDVWGFNEVLENGKTGFIIPAKDSEALALAISTLLNDEKLRKEMESNILIKCKELSWSKLATRYIDLYQELLNSTNRKDKI